MDDPKCDASFEEKSRERCGMHRRGPQDPVEEEIHAGALLLQAEKVPGAAGEEEARRDFPGET